MKWAVSGSGFRVQDLRSQISNLRLSQISNLTSSSFFHLPFFIFKFSFAMLEGSVISAASLNKK